MVFNNSNQAFQWLIDNPEKRLYDQYGNYVIYNPNSTYIEYHYEIDFWTWDFDEMEEDEFIIQFKNKELSIE